MTLDEMIASINPETYEALKRAVELGKWQDGSRLTPEQRANCLQAVIAYGERNLPVQERVGFIDRGVKEEGEMCGDDHHHVEQLSNSCSNTFQH
ncbi:MAG: DUF1315 family protein [Gammaproteobacteria bacterium]